MAGESEQTSPPAGTARSRLPLRWRDAALLLALLAIAGLLALLLIHGPSKPTILGQATSYRNGAYEGLTISPRAEPALELRNYLGNEVNVKSFLGKAVLVTFLYTHCPLACPLIASHLHTAWEEMSPKVRKEVQIIAVSVDPKGDTPTTVSAFVADHGMTGKMDYLIGGANQLGSVWSAWGVGAKADAGDPGLVNHTSLIYGITAKGDILTAYQDTTQPAVIVHDVPKLFENAPGPKT